MEVNHEIGLFFCGGDENLYIKNLKDFYNTSKTKQDQLDNCASTGYMNEYLINVHALKGIARNIGAEALSEIAYEHETKCRKNDVIFVQNNVSVLLEAWDMVLDEIENYVGLKTLSQKKIFESNGIILSRDVIDKRISQIIDSLSAFESDEAEKKLGDLLRYELPGHIHAMLLEAYELSEEFEYEKAIEVLEN